jgi:formylglycine-generating enzyme required for sulfatase activity
MGVVYRGRDPSLDRQVAIKLIHTREASEKALARFWREAQVLARVEHRHVVRIHHMDRCPAGPYLVQELVEGQPLTGRDAPVLSPEQVAQVGVEVASALEAIHAAGVVHRDLKPDNVLLRPDGSAVLLDFGVARDVGAERLTLTGEVLGTPAYMAPEQADGTHVDARADVYGLGAVLFTLLAGRAPFVGSPVNVLNQVLTADPRWPSVDQPDLPLGLEAVIRRAMEKEPAHRYGSAGALGQDLERWLAGEPPLAAGPGGRTRRGAGLVAVGVVAAGLLGAAAVASALGSGGEAGEPADEGSGAPPPATSRELAPSAPETPRPAVLDLTLLQDRLRWNAASEVEQDLVVDWVARALRDDFERLGAQRFECAGIEYRLGLFVHLKTGIELVLVPGGTYTRGLVDLEAERAWWERNGGAPDESFDHWSSPAREARVEPLLVGRFEVSMTQHLRGTPTGMDFSGEDDTAYRTRWVDTQLWFQGLPGELRLPSETEWEYLARAGSTTRFYWGEEWLPEGPRHVWCKENPPPRPEGAGHLRLAPIRAHAEATNAFGLSDVLGNAVEWCQDAFTQQAKQLPVDGSAFEDGGVRRVRRGGGALRDFRRCRVTSRSNRRKDEARIQESGFRVVRSLPEVAEALRED